MELKPVEFARFVGDGGEGGVLRCCDGAETLRQLRDMVAVAHPHGRAVAYVKDAVEERGVLPDGDVRIAEFTPVRGSNLSAQLRAQKLLAVADSENGYVFTKQSLGCARHCVVVACDARRPARENNPLRRGF